MSTHNFKVSTKLITEPKEGIEICVDWSARDSDAKTRTVNFVSFADFTITRVSMELSNFEQMNEDIEDENYDNQLSLAIHSSTWEHNLLGSAINCGCLEQLEDSIQDMFAHVVKMVSDGRCCEIKRYPLFIESSSVASEI